MAFFYCSGDLVIAKETSFLLSILKFSLVQNNDLFSIIYLKFNNTFLRIEALSKSSIPKRYSLFPCDTSYLNNESKRKLAKSVLVKATRPKKYQLTLTNGNTKSGRKYRENFETGIKAP
ncbi:hypothetical protein BpHYR1_003184 [Brachionus plicatilis]|uniref:Uncharacterized protein n=1 Tax=Brachionus plicatilis TaxID=10195 RepID=A0A3M7RPK8_BRAPC|nr:hypothetical protein BpHYR1_003184 [Brachionus plicatilis]